VAIFFSARLGRPEPGAGADKEERHRGFGIFQPLRVSPAAVRRSTQSHQATVSSTDAVEKGGDGIDESLGGLPVLGRESRVSPPLAGSDFARMPAAVGLAEIRAGRCDSHGNVAALPTAVPMHHGIAKAKVSLDADRASGNNAARV